MSQEEEIISLSNNNFSFSTSNTEQSIDNFRINIPQLDIEEPPKQLTYGNLFTFYYIHNEPAFAIGPDCIYFLL